MIVRDAIHNNMKDQEMSQSEFICRVFAGAPLVPLPEFCRARGLDFAALAADLLASVDPARLANNPAPLSPDLFD